MTYLIARLREASTWRGIINALIALGVLVDPSVLPTAVPVGLGLSGVIGMLLGDKMTKAPAAVVSPPPT